MVPLLWRALLSSWSGWGRASWRLAEAVERAGQPVRFDGSIGADEKFGAIPDFVRTRLVGDPSKFPIAVQTAGPGVAAPNRRTVYFTMWESTGVHPAWLHHLNEAPSVVVPSAYNAATFSAGGVTAPIHICPLGIDPAVYDPAKAGPKRDVFTVGMAGRWHLGGSRKGHVEGIRAFRDAFKGRDDVRLEVKCFEDDPVPDFGDPRVRIIRDVYDEPRLAEWYGSLDLYMDPSFGEGWGLQTHEAMACGVPVTTTLWSGRTAFCHPGVCIPIEYELAEGPAPYHKLGVMGRPLHDSLVGVLKRAEANRDILPKMGAAGAAHARRFTWDAAAARLLDIMERAFR